MSAAIALGGSALIAAVGFGVVTLGGTLTNRARGSVPSAGATVPPAKASAPSPKAAASGAGREGVKELLPPRKKARLPVPPRPPSGEEPDRALVRIVVDGPQNAVVRLDGVELKDWFGPPREITVGPHAFEFDPQSPECCEAGQRLSVEIRPPRSDGEVQIVKGRIPFKNAVLELTGPPGASASCGELGTFPVPSRQSFPMTNAQRRVRCTMLPPVGSPVPPKEFDVTLSPGRVFRNPGT